MKLTSWNKGGIPKIRAKLFNFLNHHHAVFEADRSLMPKMWKLIETEVKNDRNPVVRKSIELLKDSTVVKL